MACTTEFSRLMKSALRTHEVSVFLTILITQGLSLKDVSIVMVSSMGANTYIDQPDGTYEPSSLNSLRFFIPKISCMIDASTISSGVKVMAYWYTTIYLPIFRRKWFARNVTAVLVDLVTGVLVKPPRPPLSPPPRPPLSPPPPRPPLSPPRSPRSVCVLSVGRFENYC